MQEMTAELSRLKIEKVALEERNKLLEKVLSFKQQGQAQPGQGQAKGQLVSFRRHSAACGGTLGKRAQLWPKCRPGGSSVARRPELQRCQCVHGWKAAAPCLRWN